MMWIWFDRYGMPLFSFRSRDNGCYFLRLEWQEPAVYSRRFGLLLMGLVQEASPRRTESMMLRWSFLFSNLQSVRAEVIQEA